MSCEWVVIDPASPYPQTLDRKPVASIWGVQVDWTQRLDCDGAGNTLVSSTWSVHPDDDDGSVTLTGDTYTGLLADVQMGGGTDGSVYRIVNRVTDAGGQTDEVTLSLPVLETRAMTA